MLIERLEHDAARMGYTTAILDTATNQPEAVAFYASVGYNEVRRDTRPDRFWTLVHFEKPLG